MNQFRILWSVSALLVVSAFLLVSTGVPAALGQSATPVAVTAPAPDWMFVVHGMQDPYAGALSNPLEPTPGLRYVGFDVEVVNASDQPLSFAANAVYLRDDEGFSYRGGTVAGSEPPLQGRTVLGGEQARGWVWFEVPEGATLREIVLVPTAPELRVGLDAVTSIPGMPGVTTASSGDVTPPPAATVTQAVAPTVTPLPTEAPVAAATSTTAPAAPGAPTSVITIESAETPGAVAATETPRATSTPVPVVTVTPPIVTSAPTATPPAPESGIAPGSTVVTADSDANLRAGPSLDAEIIGTILLGSELTVTGPAEAGDGTLWWPVIDVATGVEGYVAEELLTPLGE